MTSVRDERSFRLAAPVLPPDAVARPRLVDRILATPPGGSCLIISAPGYGATTLLAQAANRSADRFLWLSLDVAIGDEEACELFVAGVGALGSRFDIDELIDALADEQHLWLVVDGLCPARHPRLTELLTLLASRLPTSARLAVSAHRRLAGMPRAERFEDADLAFGDDEAVELLMGVEPGLDIEQIGLIVEASEGWASALVAGARHARGAGGAGWLLESGTSVLFGDWFASLEAPHRQLLDATAVLDLLNAGLVEAVTGDPEAADKLLELDADHAYLQAVAAPEGHSGRWWRRHGLLTTFLKMRLSANSVRQHSSAADWFIERADIDSAMHHLIASGRPYEAGELLTAHESALISEGRADQVLDWYGRIPTTSDNRILSSLRIGWGQALTGDIRRADATLGRLKAELADRQRLTDLQSNEAWQEEPNHDDLSAVSWEPETALLTAYLAGSHADPATMVKAGLRAMNAPADSRTRDANQLAPLLVIRGYLWSGQPDAAMAVLHSIEDMPFPNDVIRESQLNGLRALLDAVSGRVLMAATRVDACLSWLHKAGLDPVAVSQFAPLQGQALVKLESGDSRGAIEDASRVVEAAEARNHKGEIVWALSTIARAHLLMGDSGAALRTLGRAGSIAIAECPGSAMTVVLDQMQALAHLAAGDRVRAERIIQQLPPSDAKTLLAARSGLDRQPGVARRALDSVTGKSARTQAEKHLLLAAVHRNASRRMAQGHLRRAAQLAHKNGIAQLLHPSIPGMLEFAEETALEDQDDNLLWLMQVRPARKSYTPPSGWSASLSRGELQLVALLPTRAKNAEIAQTLGVSINTVKTRLRRLYVKLGATNRDEAISKARERGLLE
ncbi:MAG: LuxR C-terminal-related transcriptional regulator [Candidatus Nanopelagicales bacterium]|nr:LuxR C-terminal-related transcriptional regulator [Candidatus Nanopelagicales bacterium]